MATPSVCRSLAAFSLWMLASFLCHKLAKMALVLYVTAETSSSPIVIALIVTLCQVLFCYASINVTSLKGPLFYVMASSHFLATLATNTSLALTFASSTMAIKMLEPATSAVLQALLLKSPMKAESVVGMVIVVAGAGLYIGNPAQGGDLTRAVIMALISNLTLGIRNVTLKLSQDVSPRRSQFRSALHVFGFTACLAFLLCLASFSEAVAAVLPHHVTHFLLLSLASSVFHVTYSYVSTNVVLRYMSVVSHALANIFKRVLVVLLLHVTGRRPASWWNWAGLVLCTVGLLLYSRRRMTSSSVSSSLTSVTSASEETHDDGTENGVCAASDPTSNRIKGTQLCRLLVPLIFVFLICVMPEKMTTTELSYFSQGSPFQSGLLVNKKELVAKREYLPETNTNYALNPRFRYENWTDGKPLIKDRLPFEPDQSEAEFVSKVMESNPKHPGKSSTDYALNLRFGYENWTDGKPLIKDPIPFQPDRKSLPQIREFLSRKKLIETPFDTDGLSPYLTTTEDVITEAKRVHFNLFRDVFKGKKYAILFELASFENKGDAALSVAEIVLLENLGIKLLFYVNLKKCHGRSVQHALKIAGKYPREEVVVLMHGGGNIIAHSNVDHCRERSLRLSTRYQQVFLSNSIWMRETRNQWDFSVRLYCCNPNLTIFLRDRLSLYIAQRIFNNGTRLVLAPDMAFHIGHVSRYSPPYYDIIWQKRTDHENALFDKVPEFPANVSVFVWDWIKMPSIHSDNSVRMAVNVMQNGLGILQKGRVVVTDRLHGHILSTLLDIPHVLLDNADQKLSSYHNTWTRGLSNCRLADNAKDAARLALELLEEYRNSLPKRLTAVDINENE